MVEKYSNVRKKDTYKPKILDRTEWKERGRNRLKKVGKKEAEREGGRDTDRKKDGTDAACVCVCVCVCVRVRVCV